MRREKKSSLSPFLSGFTLIEALASIVLIAGALIPLMIIVPQMIRNSLKSEQLTKVIFLAQARTEQVKRNTIYDFSGSKDESVTAFDSPYQSYKYIVEDTQQGVSVKNIQVQVWYDADNDNTLDSEEDSITINTKVADRG